MSDHEADEHDRIGPVLAFWLAIPCGIILGALFALWILLPH